MLQEDESFQSMSINSVSISLIVTSISIRNPRVLIADEALRESCCWTFQIKSVLQSLCDLISVRPFPSFDVTGLRLL